MNKKWEVVIEGSGFYVKRWWIQQEQPEEVYATPPYHGWGASRHVIADGFDTEREAEAWAAEHIVDRSDYGEMVI